MVAIVINLADKKVQYEELSSKAANFKVGDNETRIVTPLKSMGVKEMNQLQQEFSIGPGEWSQVVESVTAANASIKIEQKLKRKGKTSKPVGNNSTLEGRLANANLQITEDGSLVHITTEYLEGVEKEIKTVVAFDVPEYQEILTKDGEDFLRVKTRSGEIKDLVLKDAQRLEVGTSGLTIIYDYVSKVKTFMGIVISMMDRRVLNTNMGWTQDKDGQWAYIHYGGSIGPGYVNMDDVSLSEYLKYIDLNDERDSKAVLQDYLGLFDAAKTQMAKDMAYMLMLTSVRAVMRPVFEKHSRYFDMMVMLYSAPESYKTSLAVMINNLFGKYPQRTPLVNFVSTSISTTSIVQKVSDAVALVDDYRPSAKREEMAHTLDLLLSLAGDRAGRNRASKDGSVRQSKGDFNGAVIVTGEELGADGSRANRAWYIQAPNRNNWDYDWTNPRQGSSWAAAGRAFIEWLAPRIETMQLNVSNSTDRVELNAQDYKETARVFKEFCNYMGVEFNLDAAYEAIARTKKDTYGTRRNRSHMEIFAQRLREMYFSQEIGLMGDDSSDRFKMKIVGTKEYNHEKGKADTTRIILYPTRLEEVISAKNYKSPGVQSLGNDLSRIVGRSVVSSDGTWVLTENEWLEHILRKPVAKRLEDYNLKEVMANETL